MENNLNVPNHQPVKYPSHTLHMSDQIAMACWWTIPPFLDDFPSKPPCIVVVHVFFSYVPVSPMLFSYVPMFYSVFFPHVPLVFLCFSRISPFPFPSPVGSPWLRTMTGRPERAAHPGPTSWAHDAAQWRPRRNYCGTWVMRLGKKKLIQP